MDLSTGPKLLLNLAAVLIWVVVLVAVVRRHRAGTRAEAKDVLALVISVFSHGVFVPIGPVWWLANNWLSGSSSADEDPPSSEALAESLPIQ